MTHRRDRDDLIWENLEQQDLDPGQSALNADRDTTLTRTAARYSAWE